MRTSSPPKRHKLEALGRPEGGSGGTGPAVVPPNLAIQARRDVVSTLHQLIDTLTELGNANLVEPTAQPSSGLPLLLDAIEAGRLLSVGRAKVLDLAASGQIPSLRIGGSVRIPRHRLVEWIDERARAPKWLRGREPEASSRIDRSAER